MPDSAEDRVNRKPDGEANEFVNAAEEAEPGLFREFWDFLRYNKKWWLAPIFLALLALAILALFGSGPLAPLIYPFF